MTLRPVLCSVWRGVLVPRSFIHPGTSCRLGCWLICYVGGNGIFEPRHPLLTGFFGRPSLTARHRADLDRELQAKDCVCISQKYNNFRGSYGAFAVLYDVTSIKIESKQRNSKVTSAQPHFITLQPSSEHRK